MVRKLKKIPKHFQEILKVASKIAGRSGFKIYLVGGVVRDLILGKAIFDLDIVVEPDAIRFAQRLAKHFKTQFRRHHSFGTATVYFGKHKMDFATARKEHYTHWGALPKVSPVTLKEDLFRRDFTINAMAVSLNKKDYGQLVDFYNGYTDLRKGIIRVLHADSLLEDPTRILRAIRFEQRFKFRIEKNTNKLLKEALGVGAIRFVHPHRLRDEIILILQEPQPYRYIKRLDGLTKLSFMDDKLKLNSNTAQLMARVKKAISFYNKRFKKYRKIDEWLIYLAAMVIDLPQDRIVRFLEKFDLKKSERIRIISIKENIRKAKKISKKCAPYNIYQFLNPLSFETIVFFYAYYNQKMIKKNIELFFEKLSRVRLKARGGDLGKLGIKPGIIYTQVFGKLLKVKINKNLKTKQEELKEAQKIFTRLAKR